MPTYRFRPRVSRVDPGLIPADGLAGVLAGVARLGTPCLLDSAGGEPRRYSVLGFDPLPPLPPKDFLSSGLRDLLAALVPDGGDAVPGPFAGGFLGALAYDLGVSGEAQVLPAEPWGQPRVVGGLYCDFLVQVQDSGVSGARSAAGATWLVLGEEPGDGRAPLAERRARVLAALATPAPPALRRTGGLLRHTAPAEHRRRVEVLRSRIAAGDLYQANLAHRISAPVEGDPVALYAQLRRVNFAPYMGYVGWGAGALLSASPELLLELGPAAAGTAYAGDGRRRLRTRPIKGTIARSSDPVEDAARAQELLNSPKDRAELGMIVDLERNDLGRVAKPGTVRVEGFPTLRSYSAVHHLVCDVHAEPRDDVDAPAALAALFPGGSITGAPKLSSMERIAELEGEGRGFFTGSLGFVDLRGRACFNILIRTLLWRPRPERGGSAGEVSFRVGGGITYASDAEAEDRETLAKGTSLAAALGGGAEELGLASAADLVGSANADGRARAAASPEAPVSGPRRGSPPRSAEESCGARYAAGAVTAPYSTFVNGQVFAPGAPAISPLDQGLTLGLSVFDTFLFQDGVFYFFEEHVERLAEGCAELLIPWPLPWDLRAAMDGVAASAPAAGLAVRVTVTRGVPGAGPTLIVTGRALAIPADPGVVVAIAERTKMGGDALEGIKSTNRLRNVLAREEAQAQGAWEALIATEEGDLCEGTIANLFVAVDGRIVTPGLNRGALPGIMRQVVLGELGARPLLGADGTPVEVAEARVTRAQLERADEVFLTNTTGRVIPVVRVIGMGRELPGSAGPLTLAIRERIHALEAGYRDQAGRSRR